MHATYTTRTLNLCAITDIGPHDMHRTVTNDIEHVLADLVERGQLVPGHPLQRVICCDSEGYWDRVIIDDRCRFVKFLPIGKPEKWEGTYSGEGFQAAQREANPDWDLRDLFATVLLEEIGDEQDSAKRRHGRKHADNG